MTTETGHAKFLSDQVDQRRSLTELFIKCTFSYA